MRGETVVPIQTYPLDLALPYLFLLFLLHEQDHPLARCRCKLEDDSVLSSYS
jgi:hypothetical protein